MFCVDVSPSMGQPGRHGDSHLETSLKVMNQVVQQKVLLVLCGWEVWGHSASQQYSDSTGGCRHHTSVAG